MKLNDQIIPNEDLAEQFAAMSEKKVTDVTSSTSTDDAVFNGTRKITEQDMNFMSEINIRQAILSLKSKNSEGYDRIPQRILLDGISSLTEPFTKLFNLIYLHNKIPEQWSMSKIMPIHKKGDKSNIQNYRPISNLCSMSKVFEKLIMQRITEIEDLHKIDFTGAKQHGFKRSRSTSTAGLEIQSEIARALDTNKYTLMASLDLSSAFDIVNINLLIKRLQIAGLPNDVINLIQIWLSDRTYYVSAKGFNSYIRISDIGTIQGSILGPFLYAIYVAPLQELYEVTMFADDKFPLASNVDLNQLIIEFETKLTTITKWLKDSGMKINETKTELCLFYRNDHAPVTIILNNIQITSKTSINVLGVQFDSKLSWSDQVCKSINKAKKAYHAINLIKRYFNSDELKGLLTSNYYSILYYNSEIWHIPTLSPHLKQKLLSASANAIKLSLSALPLNTSFDTIHSISKRATPTQMSTYKHALQLFKLYNSNNMSDDWVSLNVQQNFNARNDKFQIYRISNYKVGRNLIVNRFHNLNNQICYTWLNDSFNTFKVKCKKLFLQQHN